MDHRPPYVVAKELVVYISTDRGDKHFYGSAPVYEVGEWNGHAYPVVLLDAPYPPWRAMRHSYDDTELCNIKREGGPEFWATERRWERWRNAMEFVREQRYGEDPKESKGWWITETSDAFAKGY